MPLFARVVPLCRTPMGVDAFDYAIPTKSTFMPGDLVRIPLRNQQVEGVIVQILKTSPFAARAKEILSDVPITRFGQDWVDLLEWLAARTFQSSASVAKAWLRLLPKKLAPWNTRLAMRANAPNIQPIWTATLEAEALQITKNHTGRILILTPFSQQAERLANVLDAACLLSDDPKTVATQTWKTFLESEQAILVTTRIGAWLGVFAETLILLEPENDEHKQDELSPRFDARLVAAWLAQRKNVPLITIGRTPPIHVDKPAPTIEIHPELCIRHAQGRSRVPGVSLDALDRVLENPEAPVVVIHPIRGMRARSQCRTCGFVIACARCGSALRRREFVGWCDLCHVEQPLPEICPRCAGSDFSGSPPGLDLLKREWTKQTLPEAEWRDGSPLALDTPFPEQAAVLVTEPQLLGGYAEDIRRTERLCRAYRMLASRVAEAHGRLILQVHEGDTDRWSLWLTADGVHTLTLAERQARSVFRYPPSVRLVKLLVDGTEEAAQTTAERLQKILASESLFLELRGPFPADGRPRTRPRFVIQALFKPETSENTLITLFSSWARTCKIDLDSVAFLR
ncbi:hypothetical protein KBB27_01325 [Patescibacteria group bacterium]|nr:hypothetical protein [Patescibacteria group bacterium]